MREKRRGIPLSFFFLFSSGFLMCVSHSKQVKSSSKTVPGMQSEEYPGQDEKDEMGGCFLPFPLSTALISW